MTSVVNRLATPGGRTLWLLFFIALLAASSVSGAGATASPHSGYTAALAAMRTEKSVHYIASFTQGREHVDYVGDVGLTQGTQQITVHVGGEQGRVTVIVSGRHAWVRGEAFALAEFLDFPGSVASKDANRWIAVPAPDYASVAADVTLGSALDTLKLSGSLTVASSRRLAGTAVVGITGASEASDGERLTLYTNATGKPLPVAEIGVGQSVVYSRWDEAISITVPTKAVRVAGGATPTGPTVSA
jgi:hypothetical protein